MMKKMRFSRLQRKWQEQIRNDHGDLAFGDCAKQGERLLQSKQVCLRSVVLYGSESRAVEEEDFVKLVGNDMMMVQWMYVALKDRKSSDEVRDCLGLVSIRNRIQR